MKEFTGDFTFWDLFAVENVRKDFRMKVRTVDNVLLNLRC